MLKMKVNAGIPPPGGGKISAEITVVGPDRSGIVAGVTRRVFESRGNIEKISQNVIHGLFGMHLEASFQVRDFNPGGFRRGLAGLGGKLGVEIKVHFDEPEKPKKMAVLVTKEAHCLEELLRAERSGEIKVNVKVILGSEKSLKGLADRHKIPFVFIEHRDQAQAEGRIVKLLERYDVDFVVLARYMRILSLNFVWRYPNRVINIHPSLLPAFAGAYAYLKAFERGAQVLGCTAHFVTDELDEGPIIWQESFRIDPSDTLDSIKAKGRRLEAQTLLCAVKLYLENKLDVYWGKVHFR